MKKTLILSTVVVASLIISGCSKYETDCGETDEMTKCGAPIEDFPDDVSSSNQDNENIKVVVSDPTYEDLMKGKEVFLDVTVEGELSQEKGLFNNNSQQDYFMVVLEGYTLKTLENTNDDLVFSTDNENAKVNNGKDKLVFNKDKDFFVDIKKLKKEDSIEAIRKSIIEMYGKNSDIRQFHQEKLPNTEFGLIVPEGNIKGPSGHTNIIYIVQKVENDRFLLEIHTPTKEIAEGVMPRIWAMLKTINQPENISSVTLVEDLEPKLNSNYEFGLIDDINTNYDNIAKELFSAHLNGLKFENQELKESDEMLQIQDYKINEIKVIKHEDSFLEFTVKYSVLPANPDKYVLAGNGKLYDNGWIKEKHHFVQSEKINDKWRIRNIGTDR